MFGKQVTVLKLFGFKVQLDASWVFLALLIVWSLAEGSFPANYPGLPTRTYWWMAVAAMVGVFLSLVFHELSHALVARRLGLPIRGITLFIFGGVAHMEEEPANPRTEFLMAVVGPISSLVLAAVFYGVRLALAPSSRPWAAVAGYLAFINLILAAFNLLPAFPLDGGRAFRAALWRWKGDMRSATRVAATVGEGFGFLLIALGVLAFFRGDLVGGLWWVLIGLFLRGAASASYSQLVIRQALEGEPLRRFMTPDPVTVSPRTSLQELVDSYVYRYHYDLFPVVEDGRLVGCVQARQLKEVPREEWPRRTVGELATACSRENTVDADTDAVKALALMNRTGKTRLLVTDRGKLVGIVTLKDLLRFLSTKIELETAA